jgi:hypothetical protein
MPLVYYAPLILTVGILFAAVLISMLPKLDERFALAVAIAGVVTSLAVVARALVP